ncbi:MAG: lipoate--protein ligase [Muribaculaceae bacterium]|nr:lipoate--protein ligase [Muribaculaceae bacterium]
MKYLRLPDNETHILPFYLAMEEYATRILCPDDIFFMWQVNPTVIFGRNQVIQNEVNLDYCNANGIEYYRRKSGGGCVFADMNNIMFSYITRSDNVTTTFERYTGTVVDMLKKLGLNASDNSRNDIMIDGLKVSGNAFYHIPGFSIVHGTMLFDTDMHHMSNAITPSQHKLQSKGVKSVPSRITTLSQHLSMDITQFKAFVRDTMCDGEVMLNDSDIDNIHAIEQQYLKPEFIMGKNPRCNMSHTRHIDGVGQITVECELVHNIIHNMNISGDFFLLGDIDKSIISVLNESPYTRASVENALKHIEVADIIMNLTNKQFIDLLIN